MRAPRGGIPESARREVRLPLHRFRTNLELHMLFSVVRIRFCAQVIPDAVVIQLLGGPDTSVSS